MRNVIGICLAAVVMSVMMAGCRVDERENMDTSAVGREALTVYQVTSENVLSPVLATLDLALKADMYVKADEYERYRLENMYFEDYRMMFYDGRLEVVDYGDVFFDGKTIWEEGASWQVACRGVESDIVCTAPGEWDVNLRLLYTELPVSYYSVDSMRMHVSVDIDSSGTAQMYGNEYLYRMEASGAYAEDQRGGIVVKVAFETVSPTGAVCRYAGRPESFHFFDGGFDMHMDIVGNLSRSEDIKVELSPSISSTLITTRYKGRVDCW
ncbi:MAG TPA: hypothetical protein IAC03_01755 [Candidatus Coprenecus pullistercoris]|nr:hypothetical protein [Candidatus Coprenecus pullistercoris]